MSVPSFFKWALRYLPEEEIERIAARVYNEVYMKEAIPIACQLHFWHLWPKWDTYAVGEKIINHIPTGKEFTDGKIVVQSRVCAGCGAMQLRKVTS